MVNLKNYPENIEAILSSWCFEKLIWAQNLLNTHIGDQVKRLHTFNTLECVFLVKTYQAYFRQNGDKEWFSNMSGQRRIFTRIMTNPCVLSYFAGDTTNTYVYINIIYHISYIKSHISFTIYHTSYIIYHISYIIMSYIYICIYIIWFLRVKFITSIQYPMIFPPLLWGHFLPFLGAYWCADLPW